jgi:hypothetical protein
MTATNTNPFATPLAFASLALLAGCSSLDRFDTKGTDAAYCGSLVARPPFADGLLPPKHTPSLVMRVSLDVGALMARGADPIEVARISTDDRDSGLCKGEGKALFEDAMLRTIPTLDHDPLSALEFATGRDYNFFGWVDSSCQNTMLAVVSLMRNDDVEVRLLKPAALPEPGAGPAESPGFGMFYLHRDSAGCPF